ncbi:hypothetical protein SI65_09746 [Aspergillus cristatus]|uniref:Zn(2)-C6 fungal-type domain-containing protein n=1 Tax=Aspergillus cristatus TaxID=573508 RepID=A0A1E3B1E7_ASPCR|nr:hypothetical protein SI65_09746 [Aspergillus cristatus]
MSSEAPRDSSEQPRTKKRARYTQVACNECKRRKLKCSGEIVCARCERDGVQCVYTTNAHVATRTPDVGESQDGRVDSQFRIVDRKIEALQREMQLMAARMREMETVLGHRDSNRTTNPQVSSAYTPAAASVSGTGTTSSSAGAALGRILNPPKSPTYIGPTSAEFGLTARRKSVSDGEESSPSPSEAILTTGDPITELGLAESLRLLSVYEQSVGIMYPCVDLDSVRTYIIDFFRGGGNALAVANATDQDWFFARDASVIKMILATALLAESHGRSERAAQLADIVEDEFATRVKIADVDMKELLILALLSIFHSYRDDEVIAWRQIGLAVRGSMQLGLHRQETWQLTGGVFPGELQCNWASRLFWCIYVLDRKWSFGTGLPFAIQDSDMDTNLPEPGAATPYLTCMINYARLSTKIWGLVVGWPSRPRSSTSDSCSYLDFQVQQWIQSIPPELRFDPSQFQSPGSDPPPDSMVMQQVLLALQANQLRILVYRQNLLSTESIEADFSGASVAVETAKRTVHMLDCFSRVSVLYFQRPEPFNYFLLSALAALFLAVLHAPNRFSQVCRPEFYSAVDLVRRSSTRARTSRRLQKIIRSLKLIPLHWDGGKPRTHDQGNRNAASASAHAYRASSISNHTAYTSKPVSTSSSPHIQSAIHSVPTEQPSTAWSTTTPVTLPTDTNNSCEDLTSFFELAGGLYFDPQIGTEVNANGNGHGVFVQTSDARLSDAIHAEDEALTRVMAGLL